jgi:hypothetical protein
MRKLLQLATFLLLTGAAATHAQITNPDNLVAPAPRNPALRQQRPDTQDLQWLWQYTRPSNKPGLLSDARFTALLRDNLKAPQAMWGIGTPLNEVAKAFLAGEGTVASTDNRHLTITGCVADQCPQRGMLSVDLGERNPLIIFFALRWNEQTHTLDEPNAPFTLWLFPSRELDAHNLPQPIKDAVSAFSGSGNCNTQKITSTIVVDPSGIPHVLGALESGIHLAVCTPTQGSHS